MNDRTEGVTVPRLIVPVLIGLVGCAVLIALGVWQVQRMSWKQLVLARIDTAITATPVAVPAMPDKENHGFLPVTIAGALGGAEFRVLTSQPDLGGPGYRIVSLLTSGDRQVLVDLGFVPAADRDLSRMAESVTITGNLHWPDEVDGWTPAPDAENSVWYARDIPAMAALMSAEPFLIVARDIAPNDLGVTPLPIDTAVIPNNHLNYAITWFLLAAVWAAMSGYLVWRTARRT